MIKKAIRSITIIALSLFLTNLVWRNVDFSQNLSTLLKASLVLTTFNYLVKPILKLLLLPITVITLGLIKLLINTLGLYTVEYFITDFQITDINLPSQNLLGTHIPQIQLNNFMAYLVTSLTISIVYNWLDDILIKVKKVK